MTVPRGTPSDRSGPWRGASGTAHASGGLPTGQHAGPAAAPPRTPEAQAGRHAADRADAPTTAVPRAGAAGDPSRSAPRDDASRDAGKSDTGRADPSRSESGPSGSGASGPTSAGSSSGRPDSTSVRSSGAGDPGSGWAPGGARPEDPTRTTVLPGGRPAAARPARPGGRPEPRPGAARPLTGRTRRARLSLRRIDPWSVFLFSLVASVFVGLALIVAVAALFAVLGSLGVTESVNQLFAEVTGGSPTTGALLTSGRIIGGAAVLAAVNVVFLTLLATLSALLYNLCASFTGGIELTLGERE